MAIDRYEQWIQASCAVGGIEQYRFFMVSTVQGLARLDCQLIASDENFLMLSETQRATVQATIKLSEQVTLSYLWVLGAYEILRTLDQRRREASSDCQLPMASRITTTKHLFERVRIPLAKFEASRRNPEDSTIAFPAINLNHGVAWLVADNTFVSRRQLSDAFLALLCDLRTERE